jgi:hypothetical protein
MENSNLLFILNVDNDKIDLALDSDFIKAFNNRNFVKEHYFFGSINSDFSEFMVAILPEKLYVIYNSKDLRTIESIKSISTEVIFIDSKIYFGMNTQGVITQLLKKDIYSGILAKKPFIIKDDLPIYKYRQFQEEIQFQEQEEFEEHYHEIKNDTYENEEIEEDYNNADIQREAESYDFQITRKLEEFLKFNNYYGSTEQGNIYSIDLDEIAIRMEDKVLINFYYLSKAIFGKNRRHNQILLGDSINTRNPDYIKFSFLLDVYEGFVSIENLILKNEYLSKMHIMRSENDETRETIMPFSLIRYLLQQKVIKEMVINDIYVGSKMYINPRNAFDISMALRFDPLLKDYINSYILMYILEISKKNENAITHIHLNNYIVASSIEIEHPLLKKIENNIFV